MRVTRLNLSFGIFVATSSCFLVTLPAKARSVSPAETQQIATDAYLHGCSSITAPVTLVQTSNVPKAEGLHAPLNQFVNVPRYGGAPHRAR